MQLIDLFNTEVAKGEARDRTIREQAELDYCRILRRPHPEPGDGTRLLAMADVLGITPDVVREEIAAAPGVIRSERDLARVTSPNATPAERFNIGSHNGELTQYRRKFPRLFVEVSEVVAEPRGAVPAVPPPRYRFARPWRSHAVGDPVPTSLDEGTLNTMLASHIIKAPDPSELKGARRRTPATV